MDNNNKRCNSSLNGKQYYTSDSAQEISNRAGGFLGIVIGLSSSVFLTSLFAIGIYSRGIDFLTIILCLSILSSCIGNIRNYIIMTSEPPGYDENCEYNPVLSGAVDNK
jgi:hypothetical protein